MRSFAVFSAVLLLAATAASAQTSAPDAAPWQANRPPRPAIHAGADKHSVYVTMPDGVRLAVDYYLPQGVAAGARLPTILQQTRYYRSIAAKDDPAGSCRKIPALPGYFAQRGYAVVVVDVRGTGASFGSRATEFGDAEVKDGGHVLDWIVAQPWSNGRVGATGTSYVGTTAELLLRNHRPALKAVAPISAGYDFYADLDFPGGVRNKFFIDNWGMVNAALDLGRTSTNPLLAKIAGPCPVEADTDGALAAAAQHDHAANANSTESLRGVEFRDDPAGPEDWPRPYLHQRELDRDKVPLLGIASWNDSGYARSAIHRFLNSTSGRQRLLIAGGNHGLGYFYAPGVTAPTPSHFDLKAELLAFFDHYVAGIDNGYAREPRVRWFTTGANRWEAADSWPKTAATHRYCLAAAGALKTSDCGPVSTLHFVPENDAATGSLTRWDTTMGQPVAYRERSVADAKLLAFTSAPLDADLQVTGSPVLRLELTNTAPDAAYFVYLEEVDAVGRAYYLTEGLVRASHARLGKLPYRTLVAQTSDRRADARPDTGDRSLALDIPLLPVSHLFKRGSRLRIVIAGSDKAHFASPALDGQQWTVRIGGRASTLAIPTAPTTPKNSMGS